MLLLDVAMRDELAVQAAVNAIDIRGGFTDYCVGDLFHSKTYPSGSPVIFIFRSAYFDKT